MKSDSNFPVRGHVNLKMRTWVFTFNKKSIGPNVNSREKASNMAQI